MTHCTTCNRNVQVDFPGFGALVPTGFWLYDSVADQEVPELDCCERWHCPHDTQPVKRSRMLPPMGSMGEEARDFADPLEGCPF